MLVFSVICGLLIFTPATLAGEMYSAEELWAVGNLWKQVDTEWRAEQSRYQRRIAEIEASSMPRHQKDYFLNREVSLHRAEGQRLAGKRHQIQEVLITESNARVARGRSPSSQTVKPSLGTSIHDRAHGGMLGDLDAQGGARTVRHMRGVLDDMGLCDIPIVETGGTFEIGGNFELCIHKTGIEPRVGDTFHEIRNQVDARNHEVYMSERMRSRATGTKQVGTDYVEVQDHFKKASDGLYASDTDLVEQPQRMQIMSKGANKTLQMGDVTDEELARILKKHGIDDTPEAFRSRLAQIKERRVTVRDPVEAARLRDASQDIFATAQTRAFERAQTEVAARVKQIETVDESLRKLDAMADSPATRARREALKKSLRQRRQAYAEELIDSRSKMKAVTDASNEIRTRSGRAPTAPSADSPADTRHPRHPGRTPTTTPDTNATGWDRVKQGGATAAKTFSVVTDIADIGNACKTLEAYVEGDATLQDVLRSALSLPPLSPVGTLVGTGERVGQSTVDYLQTQSALRDANEKNMQAYLQQWEIQLRRAGLSVREAKEYVSAALLSGNLDALEAQAERLRLAGKEITSPVLVIEDSIGPDGGAWYMWDNTKALVGGMKDSTYEGVTYILTAPGRVLTAFGERELAEAELAYADAEMEAEMQTRLFRALLNAGIDRAPALHAVQEGGAALVRVTHEAREALAEARAEAERLEEERARREDRLHAVMQRIDELRWMDIPLRITPTSPIRIPSDTKPDMQMDVSIALGGDVTQAVARIRMELESLLGETPLMDVTYHLLSPAGEMVEPGVWKGQVPARADAYPVAVRIDMAVTGLPEEWAGMNRHFSRFLQETIHVMDAQERIHFEEPTYTFRDGDYELVRAVVEEANPETEYAYVWSLDGNAMELTESPVWRIHALLAETGKAGTRTLRVELCDAKSGLLLAEAEAIVNITPVEREVMIRMAGEHVWKRYECSEIRDMVRMPYQEQAPFRARGGVPGDRTGANMEEGPNRSLLGLPDGRYTGYGRESYDHHATPEPFAWVQEEGMFRNGKKHGIWKQFAIDYLGSGAHHLAKVTSYVDDLKDGQETHYFPDGRVRGTIRWRNGEKDGVEIYYQRSIPGGIREYYLRANGEVVESEIWQPQSRDPRRDTTHWTRWIGHKGVGATLERYEQSAGGSFRFLRREVHDAAGNVIRRD